MLNSTESVTVGAGVGPAVRAKEETAGASPRKGALLKVLGLAAIVAAALGLPLYGPDAGLNAYDIYRGLVFVHVTAALVAFGSTFAIPVLQPIAALGGVVTLRMALNVSERLERVIVGPGSIVVVATGVGLMLSDMTGYRDDPPVWLLVAIGWVIATLVLANGVQGPTLRRAIALLENAPDDEPIPAALGPIAGRLKLVGQLLALSTIGVLFLMIWKPNF